MENINSHYLTAKINRVPSNVLHRRTLLWSIVDIRVWSVSFQCKIRYILCKSRGFSKGFFFFLYIHSPLRHANLNLKLIWDPVTIKAHVWGIICIFLFTWHQYNASENLLPDIYAGEDLTFSFPCPYGKI